MAGTGLVPAVARRAPRVVAGLTGDGRLREVVGVVALGALYYGAAKLGYVLEFAGPVAAIVWLPVGVAIAFLYLGGLQFWPGVVIGDLLANDYGALPLGSALGQTTGNLLEVVVATVLIRRLAGGRSPLGSVRGLGAMLAGILAATLLSATVGSLSLRLGGVVTWSALPNVWRTWWLGDACGALIVFPLAVAWSRPPPRSWWEGRVLEAGLVLVAIVGLSELAMRTTRPLTYLVFPALIWAALRFGQRGATAAVTVAVAFTVYETTHYVGPFYFHSITRSVLSTQLFIAVAAGSTLCLAAVVSEREAFARRLARSRSRLVDAADSERRRIEHNLHDGAQQRLTALALRLGLARERGEHDPTRVVALFASAESELQLAIDELRQLAHGIHPPVLTELGLAGAVNDLAARSAVVIRVLELPAARFDATAEATAYYVVSEAVANAEKHAHAGEVRLRVSEAPSVLHVEVVDDGVGGASEDGAAGLSGLRDRVESLGGTFDVDSVAGRGTRIGAAIPATQR